MRFRLALVILLLAPPVALDGQNVDARVYELDRAASSIVIVTGRSGLLSFLGHEHAILPEEWRAAFCLTDPLSRDMHGSIVVATPSLVIDSDSARALAGLGGGPGADDVREMQRKLLDAERLHADRYPEARIEADSVLVRKDGGLIVDGRITLRGITRPVRFELDVAAVEGGAYRFAGTLRVRQRDFGIQPESVAGVVRVSNDVDLRAVLVVRPTGRSCT